MEDVVKSVTVKIRKQPQYNFTKIAYVPLDLIGEFENDTSKIIWPFHKDHWTTEAFRLLGRCYTFNAPQFIKEATVF